MPAFNCSVLFIAIFAILGAIAMGTLAYWAFTQGDWPKLIFSIICCFFSLFVGFESISLDTNDNIFCTQCGHGWWRYNSRTVDHCYICGTPADEDQFKLPATKNNI